FGGADEMPFERNVHVARDLAAFRVDDEAHLLLELGRREERRVVRSKAAADDVRQRLVSLENPLDGLHAAKYMPRGATTLQVQLVKLLTSPKSLPEGGDGVGRGHGEQCL